jgi:hypothetical protein
MMSASSPFLDKGLGRDLHLHHSSDITRLYSALEDGCMAFKAASGEAAQVDLADVVRPGALLFSLDVVRLEMAANPPQAGQDPARVAARLAEVKEDALHVVREIRDGRLSHLTATR